MVDRCIFFHKSVLYCKNIYICQIIISVFLFFFFASAPFQSITKSSTNWIVLDDDNGTINEALDGTNTNINRAVTTDANDKEGDGVELDKVEEGNEKKR